MMWIPSVVKKFLNGNPLDDAELNALIGVYSRTLECVEVLGDPRYELIACDLRRQLEVLKGFRDARNRK